MAERDGFVQVAPDSLGKKIDNAEVTRADGTVIERQRIVQADAGDPDAASVGVEGEPGQGVTSGERAVISLLRSIDQQLHELLFLVKLRGG
jgi:hypothetical protein